MIVRKVFFSWEMHFLISYKWFQTLSHNTFKIKYAAQKTAYDIIL